MQVPAKEPEQRTGQGEAQDRDERLIDVAREADEPERDGGDEGDPGREAVEPVDEIDAVDHPDDPEDRERDRDCALEPDHRPAEGVRDEPDVDPEDHRDQAEADLTGQLPACAEIEQVIEGADRRGQGAAQQERRELALPERHEQSQELGVQLQEDHDHHAGTPSRPRCRRLAGSATC